MKRRVKKIRSKYGENVNKCYPGVNTWWEVGVISVSILLKNIYYFTFAHDPGPASLTKARGPGLCVCVYVSIFILVAQPLERSHPLSLSISPKCHIMSLGPGPVPQTKWVFRMLDE